MMRAHGSYISDLRIFTFICKTSEEHASEIFLEAPFLNREECQAEARDLGNKNWVIFKVAHHVVYALYNHDGQYSILAASVEDLVTHWQKEIGVYKVESPYRLFIEGMIKRIKEAVTAQ